MEMVYTNNVMNTILKLGGDKLNMKVKINYRGKLKSLLQDVNYLMRKIY
jgi:hypothetical protein